MIEFFRWLWSISFSLGGLSVVTCILAIVALLVGSRILALLPDWAKTVLIFIAVGAGLYAVGYGTGRHDERGFYKGRINREIAKNVLKGEHARAEALQEFDNAHDLPDDGFRRSDD